MSRVLIAIALTAILGPIARRADNTTTKHTSVVKIKLTIDNKILTATLADSKTARDFISLLPLTLTMTTCSAERNMPACREQSLKRGNERTLTKLETWL